MDNNKLGKSTYKLIENQGVRAVVLFPGKEIILAHKSIETLAVIGVLMLIIRSYDEPEMRGLRKHVSTGDGGVNETVELLDLVNAFRERWVD